ARWGLRVSVQEEDCELTPEEARLRYCEHDAEWLGAPNDAVVADHLPAIPGARLLRTYADWFAAARAWIPCAATADRIGVHELQPGIWVGLHSHIAPDALWRSPCWIGENVHVSSGAVIGPNAVLENNTFVDQRA